MKRRRFSEYGNYRHPRTRNEQRMSFAHGREFVRAKRYGHNLPNTYDDIPVSIDRKCWKSKREKQYRIGKRGQKREVFLDISVHEWYITEYLEEQDIPYRIVDIKKSQTYYSVGYGREITRAFHTGSILTYWSDKEIQLPKEAFRFRFYFDWRILL
jgi:hypothetical protein